MTSTDPVGLDVDAGVATITLNRPDAMNGLDVATKDLLLEHVQQVAADPEVRCVVLTGSGRAFCVGQDLKEHLAGLRGDTSVPLRQAQILEKRAAEVGAPFKLRVVRNAGHNWREAGCPIDPSKEEIQRLTAQTLVDAVRH